MKKLFVVLSTLGIVSVAAPAFADPITIPDTIVYGRNPRPSAAVEVSKARMQLPLTTPTLAAITRIENATKKDPF